MAIRFAKQAGNWSDPNTWDGGVLLPQPGDEVYLNGYNITIDQNVTVGRIGNIQSLYGVPGDPIPNMVSNTTPNSVGRAFATQAPNDAWIAFQRGVAVIGSHWNSFSTQSQIGYEFNTPKNIQRYSWYSNQAAADRLRTWNFEGSNDGVTWVVLHNVTNYASSATYFSPVISNPSSYTYYRINGSATQGGGFTRISAIGMTESTDLSNGYGGSSTATVNNNITITADFYLGTATTNLFTVPALSPNQVTFIGNAPGDVAGNGSNNPALINATGTGTINYIGNIRATNQNAMGRGIQLASGTTLNFTGDILGSRTASTFSTVNSQAIICGAGSTVNMVGSVISSETGLWNRGISTASNAIVNITGNVDGGVGTDPIRICSGVSLGGGTVTIVGNVYAGPNTIGVEGSSSNTAPVRITGNLYNWTDGSMAAFTRFLFLESANMQWNFKKFNLTDNILYTPGVATGHPAEANVRTGVVYGPTNNLTGTCAVPPANAVSVGVPVDNTVGTASLDANALAVALDAALTASLAPALTTSLDASLSASLPAAIAPLLWDESVTNITTPNSIGERLKNCATVATTGAQISSFNP